MGNQPTRSRVLFPWDSSVETHFPHGLRETRLELAQNTLLPRALQFVANRRLHDLDEQDAVSHGNGERMVRKKMSDNLAPSALNLAFVESLGETEFANEPLHCVRSDDAALGMGSFLRQAPPILQNPFSNSLGAH